MSGLRLVKALMVGLGLTVAVTGTAWADATAAAPGEAPAVKVVVNGTPLEFKDGAPYLDGEKERVYVPLRYVSQGLGADVDWLAEAKTAVVELADRSIEMTVDETVPLVDGSAGAELDAPARLEDGRVMVPLRFVSETLGYAADWAGEESTVFIETPTEEPAGEAAPVITERLAQSVTDEAEVNMRIPVVSGLADPALEEKINAELLRKAEDFRHEVTGPFAEYKEAAEKTGAPVRPFQVVVDYADHYNQDGLLSLSMIFYGDQAGAHGFTVQETLNLDVDAGARLTMADFFKPDEDYADIVVREIQKQIDEEVAEATEEHPSKYFVGHDGIEDARDTVAEIATDKEFYIGDGEIVVYFAQYDIAPYAAGMPEFAIPVSVMPGADQA